MAGKARQDQVQSPRYIPQCGGTCLTYGYLTCRALLGPGICTPARGGAFCIGDGCVPGPPPSMAGFHFHRRAFEAEKRWAKRESGHRASGPPLLALWGHEVHTSRKVRYRQGFAFPRLPDSTSANHPHAPGRYLCTTGYHFDPRICSTHLSPPSLPRPQNQPTARPQPVADCGVMCPALAFRTGQLSG
jgi:hypothetical protein